MLRVATDVGGTFTDLVAFRIGPDGQPTVVTAKVDSTPPDFETGVLAAMAKAGLTFADADVFAHGTTVIINALTERKGAKTALITTAGFRDVLEIARGNRPDFFNLAYRKPEPFVPRPLRREVAGRVSYQGDELEALDLTSLPAMLDDFRGQGVQAVAVCLLHAYANPDHERRVVAEVRRLWPAVSVVMEVVGLHAVAVAEVGRLEPAELPETRASPASALKHRRVVDYATQGCHLADIYQLDRLGPAMAIVGPAVIEDPGTTILLHPGDHASVDVFGNVHIAVAGYSDADG